MTSGDQSPASPPSLIGDQMLQWAKNLYPMRRSLSGPGVRETLDYLKQLIPGLTTHAIQSGTDVLDWTVPNEWVLRDAFLEDQAGKRVIDLADHGLHVVGYSEPVDKTVEWEELQKHLYSLPDDPDAIPYVTSYYKRRWGFCLSQRQRDGLLRGRYRAVIDADLKPGVLDYADCVLPGESDQEIVLSTYICHPMMANNELSGPVVAAALARWLMEKDRRFTYRFIFVPETIGAIIYLSQHMDHMKAHTHAGFILTCLGDDRAYSFLPSRLGNTVADRAARHILTNAVPDHLTYSFLARGSDERQYCSPLVDLPFVSIMRTKYGEYPEYHTSKDDFSVVTATGLAGGFRILQTAIEALEVNKTYIATVAGEPQMGKRNLYPTLSKTGSGLEARTMMNVLAYADGRHDLIQIADIINQDVLTCATIAQTLVEHGLLEEI